MFIPPPYVPGSPRPTAFEALWPLAVVGVLLALVLLLA